MLQLWVNAVPHLGVGGRAIYLGSVVCVRPQRLAARWIYCQSGRWFLDVGSVLHLRSKATSQGLNFQSNFYFFNSVSMYCVNICFCSYVDMFLFCNICLYLFMFSKLCLMIFFIVSSLSFLMFCKGYYISQHAYAFCSVVVLFLFMLDMLSFAWSFFNIFKTCFLEYVFVFVSLFQSFSRLFP